MHQIAESAKLGTGTKAGYYCVVGEGVTIGNDCTIGHHVVIGEGCIIGNAVRIDHHSVIGKQPMKSKNSAVTGTSSVGPATIGDGCLIGTGAIIYAGAVIGCEVLVADLATIREDVEVGDYTIVGRGVAIENQCRIGRYCKLETNAYIAAYSELADRVFIAPAVVTTNDNFVGRSEERFKHFKGVNVRKGGRIGANATILPGKTIEEDSLVAAGSVVARDTPSGQIVLGAPARVLREVPGDQLLKNQGWD